ncbi:MAG: SDR family oxidoreductase [Proteobacteria bacterium]|nr:SDR family oxidoreductase [Pseudomonadota bacterium]
MSLSGRTAFVDDADTPIGAAIVRALDARGAKVHRHAAKAGDTGAHVCDLADEAALLAMMARVGPVDILVHISCPQHIAPVEEFPSATWRRILDVGVTSSFLMSRAVLPHMRAKGWGRIVNMSSVQGLVASVDKSAYVAAKHALVGFTKALALETAGSGVTCNAFCPGWTGTDGTKAQAKILADKLGLTPEEGLRKLLEDKQPSNAWVSVDALGELVAFLCSPAADQITGLALPVDGGWVAR